MKRFIFILICIFTLGFCLHGQPKCHIVHYGQNEGLSIRAVMNILQDHKGFMWFATFDGLIKFDGYSFTSYKPSINDPIFIRNNRIDKINEDKFGYIWVHTYGSEILRFNPRTEKYVARFQLESETSFNSQVFPMKSGKVWLTSKEAGAICVLDTINRQLKFNLRNKLLLSNTVYSVWEDFDKNSWLLTGNGIVRYSNSKKIYHYLNIGSNPNGNPFFSVCETPGVIWFGGNKGKIWRFIKAQNRFDKIETGVKSNIICIKKIYDNLLIILTSNDGFFIFNTRQDTAKKYNKSNLSELPSNNMLSCFVDKSKCIWIECDSYGVSKFDPISNKLRFYPAPKSNQFEDTSVPKFFIAEDKTGRVWVHPQGGGFSYYDKQADKLRPFFNTSNSPNSKFSNKLHDLFVDRQGNLWLSTRSGGLEKVVFDNDIFHTNDFKTTIPTLPCEVRAILEDRNKNIWLANKGGAIYVFDFHKKFKGYVCTNGEISKSGKSITFNAYSFAEDKIGNIWIGTKGNGVFLLSPKEEGKYSIKQYKYSQSNKRSLSFDLAYSIYIDNKDRVWIGTFGGGLNLYDKNTDSFFNFRNEFTSYPINIGAKIRCINSCNNIIYVGTTLGLIAFSSSYKRPENIHYKIYEKSYNRFNGLKSNDIYDVCFTRKKELLVATFGGGISQANAYDKNGFPSSFKTFDMESGLQSDIVLSITKDNQENLWINSETSLTRLNLENNEIEQYNNVNRVLSDQFFSETLPVLSSQGEIIMGTTKGTISFSPIKLTRNKYKPYMALTKLTILNKNQPIKIQVDYLSKIALKYDENTISIEFAALDFTDPDKISYAYKLEGVDKDWIYSRNVRVVNYSKLTPGNYMFKVKSTNSDGTWVNNERSLLISIKPPFWKTYWAYSFYIVILYFIFRWIFSYFRMKDKIRIEHEQTEMKSRFFTDISHEIRTPLTMIISPLENLMENKDVPEKSRFQLQLILKNANRMLKMVNQILDFRKIQKQKFQVKELQLGVFVENLCNDMVSKENQQGVSMQINNRFLNDCIWANAESLEKLVFNLVSNSLKYTEKGKSIFIEIFRKDKTTVVLQVRDEGKGMTRDVLGKIFTRFASFNTDNSKPSTGIGLSIVKEIVDKHHARIFVKSEIGKGSCFTILFQSGFAHFVNDQNVEIIHNNKTNENFDKYVNIENNLRTISKEKKDKRQILLVEDDEDMRTFICQLLIDEYTVLEAANGKEGYEIAIQQVPDFILSDVMMPIMDGMEFLRKIRENSNTSHIPFILLTAKTSTDDFLEGINYGADDYITKPFNVKILKAKIANIIDLRKRLAHHLMGNSEFAMEEKTYLSISENNRITEKDRLFIENLRNYILENIENSKLSIADLVANTNFSRRVFFNKLKSLTGFAPVEFVRETRIIRAAEFLRNSEYRVKEITYMVGFTDPKYFTQCFKKKYGMSPIAYKKKKNENSLY